ncbi:hypothetical protein [Embleya sp. NBC_00896]|uniref:hypothetical protein n=1 Tax=Embleya sp. NBC_00896 TaxID=2975961 RepID=UPI00386FD464
MPAHLPGAVVASDFPALEHLDLWLGVAFYGGDATVGDLTDLLTARNLPRLRHLGLMNSEIQDDIAAAVAAAPVVARLSSLDLSMGNLSDTGAESLLDGQPLTHLRSLSLRHHFVGEAMQRRLREHLEPAGVTVDLSDAMQRDEWSDPVERYERCVLNGEDGRYTQVSE